ncbi:3,4-dihydroxy-2-butanone-4-phosphate synthase [Mycolicibacterium sp. S2-37]|uniref:3,4-dihydroxy-2-butanone-4-phosphate synthase n=1 Tax=Mycolicibacterium sp. S2-37 TaxID=2810297 RepID=UPI001A941F74|nr:3,4-dihydroxy-2-butanone-4-phosphate synthase [Mycolicibacterium sp. S2-37]
MNSTAGPQGAPGSALGPHSTATRVASACAALSRGELIVLTDGRESALVVSGSAATTTTVARMIREGSGLVFVALSRQRLAQLRIGRMTADGAARTAEFHVAVDAAEGIGTGISAADRTRTIHLLADPGASGANFVRPGHVMPVAGDITPKHTPGIPELALALVEQVDRLAPVAAYCALTSRADSRFVAGPVEGAEIAGRESVVCLTRGDVLSAYYGSDTVW